MADEEEKKEEPKVDGGIPLWKWVLGGAGAYVLGTFIVDHMRATRLQRRLQQFDDESEL